MLKVPGWTRDAEILALDLYFKNGRRPLSPNSPEVISLADAIGKKPSATTMRMGNFVACDSENPSGGLANFAKQTKSLWDEFAHDEPRLRKTASEIRRKYGIDGDG